MRVPSVVSPVVVEVHSTAWPARCLEATPRRICFRLLTLDPPSWTPGQKLGIRWESDQHFWSRPALLDQIQDAYEARWTGASVPVGQRQMPRLPVAIRVNFGFQTPDWTTVTDNITLFGAGFPSAMQLRPGDKLRLFLYFRPPLAIRAQVMRVQRDHDHWRVGVSWVDTDPLATDRLRIALDAAMRMHQ